MSGNEQTVGFNRHRLEAQLGAAGYPAVALALFDQLPSTSQWLKEQLQAPLPLLCATDWQTEGVARRGREWQTPRGSLTASLAHLSRLPPKQLMGLSLVTGIAIADALHVEFAIEAALKWPNDVLVNDRKLAGILIELEQRRNGTRVLTGMGINVVHDAALDDLGIGATSLEALNPQIAAELARCSSPSDTQPGRPLRDRLLARVTASVLDAYALFESHGWGAFAARWQALDALAGRVVTVHRGEESREAVARGVDENGALLVEWQDEQRDKGLQALYSGEVTVRPRP